MHIFLGTIVSIDLDPREIIVDDGSEGYRVVRLRYAPTRIVIFIQSAYDAGLHIPPFNRGEIAVGVETRDFQVTGLHDKIYYFKRAQLPLLPGHLSSVYRAQVRNTPLCFVSAKTFQSAHFSSQPSVICILMNIGFF